MKIRASGQRAQHVLFPLVLVALSLFQASFAFAGTIRMRDTAQLLTSHDRSELESAARHLPFDVLLLTSTAYVDQSSFSRHVGSEVREPNEIVIGLDPQHHFTQVHFGTGSHVARAEWPAIERAGNGSFRNEKWAEGVVSIFDKAAASVEHTGAGPLDRIGTVAEPSHHNGFFGMSFVSLLMLGGVGLFIFFVISRIARAVTGGPTYQGGGGYGPGYGQGYGGPGYGGNPGGGMGPLGGGIIGAGLGGLAGYELGKMAGEHESEDRRGHHGSYDSGSSDGGNDNFDAGGGGSSWDGGGDSGGGSDGGGGGGDSGGGGSDW